MAPQRISERLAILSSTAVLAVYGAGFALTKPAAEHLAELAERRGPAAATPEAALDALDSTPVAPRSAPAMALAAAAQQSGGSSVPLTSTPKSDAPASNPASKNQPANSALPAAPTPATNAPAAAAAPVTVAAKTYKDGTFYGWGYCRHGTIQASVTIVDGRIVSSAIVQCLTRYPISRIAHLPSQVVARQSPEVDYVSGATQSGDAFYGAVFNALAQAK